MQSDLVFNIKDELKKLPSLPGVYIMYSKENEIIYIGKSKSLKNRVKSYFVKNHTNKKVEALVSQIFRFEYIIVNNEMESLILEANLIKKNRPKYNINLKDDKQYPYIKITNEKFPKILKVREIKNDKGLYFGPFPNVSELDELIEICISIYNIRTCNYNFNLKPLRRACISYDIRRCKAPCVNKIDESSYNYDVNKTIEFLSGNISETKNKLFDIMKEHSNNLEYELASKYRDYYLNVDNLVKKQIFNIKKLKQYHLISYSFDNDVLVVAMFILNDGLIIDRKSFIVENSIYDDFEESFSSVIRQFYIKKSNFVKEIYIDYDNEYFLKNIKLFLESIYNKNVKVSYAKKGVKREQLDILNKNSIEILNKSSSKNKLVNEKYSNAISYLKQLLGLNTIVRIESYDISNISGSMNVGSMVVYKKGFKSNKDYRKFNIKDVSGQDDYASHREMFKRRLNRLIEKDNSSFSEIPDIIFVDGGQGHLNVYKNLLKEYNLNIKLLGLVKNEKHRTKGIIYNDEYIELEVNSNIYRFLFEIQEETHRFAITHHRNKRSQELKYSVLDEISGIGDIRKRNLLSHFGNISLIKKASIEELNAVDSIDHKTAVNIFNYFKENK